MEEQYYCPECNSELEKIAGCGSVAYFCGKCKKIISRTKMLTKEQLKENMTQD